LNAIPQPPPRHKPKRLAEDPRAAVAELVQEARQGGLVLYTGAGLSLAEPAAGPRSWQVADRMRPVVAELVGVEEEVLAGDDLEHLAARVAEQAADKLSELRRRAADAAPFCAMEPNYGHEAVALVMREGLVKAVTVNWDLGIETAGLRLDIQIAGVSTPLERAKLGPQLPLYKVHGCASRPETLRITREEIDEPMKWVRAEVQQALAGGTVIFIGLGTVGAYVSEPFDELAPLWRAVGATLRVVDPELSDAWASALADEADGVYVDADAAEFLDDLLRAVVREALGQASQRIRAIQDERAPWARTMLSGIERLRAALGNATGQAVLRWMRDGVTQTRDGQQFILDHAGEQSLMALALLAGADGGALDIELRRTDLAVRTPRQYLEIASRPGEGFQEVERSARERVRRRREQGLYGAGGSVAVAVHGTIGPFPDFEAPVDIAAAEDEEFDVAAGIEDNVRLLRAERAVAGDLAA
jgi:hypothetical protein